MSKKKEQKLPKWFDGEVYDKGAVVQNRFGGAEIELNNIELSMYDLVMGASIITEMGGGGPGIIKDLRKRKGLSENNPTAEEFIDKEQLFFQLLELKN